MPLIAPRRGRRRRLLAAAAAAPALFAVLATAGGGVTPAPLGWLVVLGLTAVVGAATLATYVPRAGQSLADAAGCAPCSAMSAMTVVGAAVLLASDPHAIGMALVALTLVAFGLVRRRTTDDTACSTPGRTS